MALVAAGKTNQASYPNGSKLALWVHPLRAALKAVAAGLTLVGSPFVGADWPLHGADTFEQRQSPLTQINPDNIQDLGLAWSFDTGTRRGLEASPIVIDGTLYTTGSWSKVYALDAVTGAQRWFFDPEVPKAWSANACCDVVNRGVAVLGESAIRWHARRPLDRTGSANRGSDLVCLDHRSVQTLHHHWRAKIGWRSSGYW